MLLLCLSIAVPDCISICLVVIVDDSLVPLLSAHLSKMTTIRHVVVAGPDARSADLDSLRAGGKEVLTVTISIGVAATGGEGDTPEALLKRADDAVYEAKAMGRNKVIAKAA